MYDGIGLARLEGMKSLLANSIRWILVLPASVAAAVLIEILVGFGTGLFGSPILEGSIRGVFACAAFITAGLKVCPIKSKLTSILLSIFAVLFGLLVLAGSGLRPETEDSERQRWCAVVFIGFGLVSILNSGKILETFGSKPHEST